MLTRWFLALIVLCLPSTGRGDELLEQGLSKMAGEIKNFLTEEKLPMKIVVGDFSGVPKLRASGGVEISRLIADQLKKVGIVVADDATLQLMGRFKLAEKKQHVDDSFESLALEINATVLNSNDDELAELSISVFGSVALQIAGQTADLPTNVPEEVRQGKLIEQLRKPPTETDQGKTKPSGSSPFAIEVLVRNGNRLESRSPKLDELSRAFVELHNGEEYIVRLYNDAPFEVGVTLTIDGVNMFVDALDADKNSRLIIAAGTHGDVPGWVITTKNTKAFKIGGYEESVAKQAGKSTGIGTITATFQACWETGGPRPADESGARPKGGKATIKGSDIGKNYRQVNREYGAVRAVVSVRYDR